ncbi:MAG: ABC transporter substrate-binding protein [Rhodospirillaceae bacterium]|nr:ABC transporter substrate-binding protein [Rhodospirillaceae bacterium]
MTPVRALMVAAALLLPWDASAELLRVGRVSNAASLGNPFTAVGQPSVGVWSAMYDALTVIGEDGKVEPALARTWAVMEPTRWRFELRSGVTYHDGMPFTAQSVVGVVDFLRSAAGRRYYVGSELAGIVSVTAQGPLTVDIVTAKPDPLMPKRMALVFMVEPNRWAKLGDDDYARTPVGTGAFKWVSWGDGNSRPSFAAYDKAWRKSASVTRLEMAVIADASVRLQALMAGQIDAMEGVSPDDVPNIDPARFTVMTKVLPAVVTISLRNVGNPASPIQNKAVRQALSLAVDRAGLAAAILGDRARAANQGASAQAFGFNPDLPPLPFDPAKAKAMLAEAGYPNGFPLQIEVMTGFGGNDRLIYEQVAQNLRSVGVKVDLRGIPYSAWLPKFSSGEWGNVDAFSFMWDSTQYYDAIRPIRNSSCAKSNPFYCDPAIMPLIEASDTEMDETKRQAMLRDILARMREDASALWIVSSSATVAMRKGVSNLRLRSVGMMYDQVIVDP